METFRTLFGSLLAFVYHCFDRIVIQGYLPLLTRPEHLVHFFRDVHHLYPLTKEMLAKRTQEYQQWVDAYARNHRIPIEWPDAEPLKTKKLKKEDYVRPYGARMERQRRFGVYFIFKSLEQGPKFSKKDRAAINLRRAYSLNQVEYCEHVPRNMFAVMCPPPICGAGGDRLGLARRRADSRAHFDQSPHRDAIQVSRA